MDISQFWLVGGSDASIFDLLDTLISPVSWRRICRRRPEVQDNHLNPICPEKVSWPTATIDWKKSV